MRKPDPVRRSLSGGDGMKLSMEFIWDCLRREGLTLTPVGDRERKLRGIRLFRPGTAPDPGLLYFPMPGTAPEAVREAWVGQDACLLWPGSRETLPPAADALLCPPEEDPVQICNRIAELFSFFGDWCARVYGAMVDDRPLEEICAFLNEVTPNPWYISDASYRMLAIKKDQDAEEMSAIWRYQYRERHLPIDVVLSLVEDGKLEQMNSQRSAVISRKLEPFVIPYVSKTIFLPEGILGHFHIVGFYTRLGCYEREIADIFGDMLARVFAGDPAYLPTSGRFFDNYFVDLIEGRNGAMTEIMDKVFHRFGWELEDSFALILISRQGRHILAHTARDLELQVLERLYGYKCFLYRDKVVALADLTRRSRGTGDTAEDGLLRSVEDILRDFGGSAGISEVFSGKAQLEDLGFYYKQAEVAAGYAAAEEERPCCTYPQVALQHLGDRLLADGTARFVYHRALEQLTRFDRENDARLYETLRLYLENEQNTMETARRLFVHRNTLLHRLQKIGEMTRLDLTDPQVRLRLQLSLLLDQRRALGRVHSEKE